MYHGKRPCVSASETYAKLKTFDAIKSDEYMFIPPSIEFM